MRELSVGLRIYTIYVLMCILIALIKAAQICAKS